MALFIDNKLIKSFTFPGGECHVNIDPLSIGNRVEIVAYLQNSNDIMCLMLVVDAIRRIRLNAFIFLEIPYFPYARQDRVCTEGDPLSVRIMANLINSLHCKEVKIYDPHSEVTPVLINNCSVRTLNDLLASSSIGHIVTNKNLLLISPDSGAEKKVDAVAKSLGVDMICASKTRNTATGEITGTQLYGDVQGRNVIIIDDICDGGRTFVELAKVLKTKGAKDIYLYVTHGIFSKGLSELSQYFKHIYCYHTFLTSKSSLLTALTTYRE